MLIDIIFALFILMAIVKGFQRGFIVAIFSIIALLAGLAAAIKLSALAAVYLKDSVNISTKWLPVLSFVIVFIIAVLLVRLGAGFIEKTIEFAMLGWLNRLLGILVYVVLYTIIFSVLLFYAEKLHLLTAEVTTASVTYRFIQPWAAWAINGIGVIIPYFKNMFHELEAFFERIPAHNS